MADKRTFSDIGNRVQEIVAQSSGTTEDLVSFLLKGNPIYHGFGPVRFARYLESGLIFPSDDNWHNPYSTSEIYFSPRWDRAAGHYPFTNDNFEKEMAVLQKIAQGLEDEDTKSLRISQQTAQEALATIRDYQTEVYGSRNQGPVGFVVEVNLPSDTVNLVFGNPVEAYDHYLQMFDEDCWRLDVENNPNLTRVDSNSGQRGLDSSVISEMYLVSKRDYSSRRVSLRSGKQEDLGRRYAPAVSGQNLILPELTYKDDKIILNKW